MESQSSGRPCGLRWVSRTPRQLRCIGSDLPICLREQTIAPNTLAYVATAAAAAAAVGSGDGQSDSQTDGRSRIGWTPEGAETAQFLQEASRRYGMDAVLSFS